MRYLKRFAITGSICPSTRIFGERVAAETAALASVYDRVVVAGIGSGVVAHRIALHCPDAVFVECDPDFSGAFATRHPHARVVTDRVERTYEHEPSLKGQRILLVSLVPTAGSFYSDEIVRFFVGICRNGGQVLQMRYLPHQMSARFFDGMRDRGIQSIRLFTVARNLPPVSMYGLRSIVAHVPHRTVIQSKQPNSKSIESIAAKSA